MQIHLGEFTYMIEELEIALRYAASDASDADTRAALLIAAAALASLAKEANGA